MPVNLAYADADAALAQKIAADLSSITLKGGGTLLIALISPASNADSDVQAQIIAAAEQRQHIVPLLVADANLPRIIDHLQPLDFRAGAYPFNALKEIVITLTAPDAPRPVTTHTPSLQQRNLRAGIIVGLLALIVFVAGIYGVGVLGIQVPQEEYDAVETQRVQQRNTLIAPTLEPLIPVGQFAISQFDLTVTAVPTRLREFLIGTVTATAQGTFIPTSTPRPTENE